MAKKSQRRSLRNEKDQAGCIWGLINIFDFRHGRSTRKLLADRRRGNLQAVGAESPRTKLSLTDPNVKYQDMEDGEESQILLADTAKTSVKKLMEEEMFKDEVQNNQIDDSEVGSKLLDAEFGGHKRKHHKRRNKMGKKSNVLHLSDLDALEDLKYSKSGEQVKTQSMLEKGDLEIIVQELCQIHQTSCGCVEHLQNDTSSDMQLDQSSTIDKEKLAAAFKMFVDRSLCNNMHSSEDERVHKSREFMDALYKVSSNKELLLKFLQDPNSLLVKQSIGFEEKKFEKHPETNPLPRSDFLEEKIARSKTDDLIINQKPRKFFRRRSRSQEHFPLTESEKSQSSSKIVILKPGPATLRQPETQINVGSSMPSHYPIDNKINGERSQFSFTEIKRKLKHAIRKERQGTSPDGIIHKSRPENPRRHDIEKGVGGENAGWCSPNRNHFYMERFAKPSVSFKRAETNDKTSPTEATTANDHLQPRVSNIYVEAKKHLLEMLSTGNDGTDITGKKLPKSLGRILSFSEYNYSPSFSPRKDREESFPSTPMKLSPRAPVHSAREGTHQLVEEDRDTQVNPSKSSSETQPCLPYENCEEKIELPNESANALHDHDQANIVEKTVSSISDMIIAKGPVEIEATTNTSCQEAGELHVSHMKGDAAEECNEDRLFQSPKMESVGENQVVTSPVSSSSHSVTKKDEVSEDCLDRTGRPSPVSVLDPLFAEDDISPARTISKPVELEIQPRQINFEEQMSCSDQGACLQTSLQDEESAFEYVEAVLLGSGLNWDEYQLRWLSSCPILDSVLYDEVELFSSRSRPEQKLLFDCTNEVLEEVCDSYFGPLSGGKEQNMRAIPKAMDLILEIWQGVEWHLLQHPQLPQSLDQLVRKDMAKSKSKSRAAWMDLRADTQHIGEEMEKAILETLVEDTISSFIDDTSHSNHALLQADSRS